MTRPTHTLLFLLLFLPWNTLAAQEKLLPAVGGITASVRAEEEKIEDILAGLEQHYPVRFFYLESWLADRPAATLQMTGPIEAILDSLFTGSDLSFLALKRGDFLIINNAVYMQSGTKTGDREPVRYQLSGTVTEANTGKPIPGATLQLKEPGAGLVTDGKGWYSFSQPAGNYTLQVSSMGFQDEHRTVRLNGNVDLNIELYQQRIHLEEIRILGDNEDQHIRSVQPGLIKITAGSLIRLPYLMGEPDVINTLLLMPGVSSAGEGAGGFNVRGGKADENLVMLDEMMLFNPSHLLGFFSVFNPEAISSYSLYKGGIPASYGGRMSSVLQVRMQPGDTDAMDGTLSTGTLASRFSLGAPLFRGKTTIRISGRMSHVNPWLKRIREVDIRNSRSHFYDGSLLIRHQAGSKDRITAGAYLSGDRFDYAGREIFHWLSWSSYLKWNHTFNDRIAGSATLSSDHYSYDVTGQDPAAQYQLTYGIHSNRAGLALNWQPSHTHFVEAGADLRHYRFLPGTLRGNYSNDRVIPGSMPEEFSLETAIYLSDEVHFSEKLSVMGGLRFSMFHVLGPMTVNEYMPGEVLSGSNVTGTRSYGNNEKVTSFSGLEPRLSIRYTTGSRSSLKAGYHRINQYIHLISNTTAISPVDIWKQSGPYIPPEWADQVSVGYFIKSRSNRWEFSTELYLRMIRTVLEYKDGAWLIMNPNLETELVSGEGRAYGMEFQARKTIGRLTGWLSYTLSRSERRVRGSHPGETINEGAYYPSPYDHPHDLNLVLSQRLSRKVTLSATFVCTSGRPVTYPDGKYVMEAFLVTDYSGRNNYRIPAYHRADLSMTIGGSLKRKRKWQGTCALGVYNLYGRKNAYSVFYRPVNQLPIAYRLSMIGVPVPSVGYTLTFLP